MSKQVNTDYLIKLFTERSYAVSRDGIDALNLGMTVVGYDSSDLRSVWSRLCYSITETQEGEVCKHKESQTGSRSYRAGCRRPVGTSYENG